MKKLSFLKHSLLALATIGVIMTAGTSFATQSRPNGKIRVASPGLWYPFSGYDSMKKEWKGFDIDMWNEIGKRAGYDIEFVRMSLVAAFAELDLGHVDTVAQQISITPAREEKYDFTIPYFLAPTCLTIRGDNDEITCWADMKGKTIALLEGDAMIEFINALDPRNLVKKAIYEHDPVRDVALGRADACCFPTPILPYFLKKNPDLSLKCVDTDHPLFVEVSAFPFSRTERGEILCKTVNKVLNEMFGDGGYEEICVKWFNTNVMDTGWAKEYMK